jgi:xanthine/CO dehydrogenase XdhC/CoxF family maturation factor
VGGGWIEHQAVKTAQEMLTSNVATCERDFTLGGPKTNTPMLCGGATRLFFQLIGPQKNGSKSGGSNQQ